MDEQALYKIMFTFFYFVVVLLEIRSNQRRDISSQY